MQPSPDLAVLADAAEEQSFPHLGDLEPVLERHHRTGPIMYSPKNLHLPAHRLLVGLRPRQPDGDSLAVPDHVLEPEGSQFRPPQGAGKTDQQQRFVPGRGNRPLERSTILTIRSRVNGFFLVCAVPRVRQIP